jgi:hypothetical protein
MKITPFVVRWLKQSPAKYEPSISKCLPSFYETKWSTMSRECRLHTKHYENLKSHNLVFICMYLTFNLQLHPIALCSLTHM